MHWQIISKGLHATCGDVAVGAALPVADGGQEGLTAAGDACVPWMHVDGSLNESVDGHQQESATSMVVYLELYLEAREVGQRHDLEMADRSCKACQTLTCTLMAGQTGGR